MTTLTYSSIHRILSPNALAERRKGAHGEIDGAGLEPGLQMRAFELDDPQADVRRFDRDALEQRRQQLDDAGVDDAELKRAVRMSAD